MKLNQLQVLGSVVALGGLTLGIWRQQAAPMVDTAASGRGSISGYSAGSPLPAGETLHAPSGAATPRESSVRQREETSSEARRNQLMTACEADWACPEKGPILRKALANWAIEDVEACAAWLKIQSPVLGESLALDVAGSLIADSALSAFLLLNEFPAGPKMDEMMRQAAMELATADSAAAQQWANSQPDPAASELLWSAVATVMAENTPEDALSAALEHLTDPIVRDRVTLEIVQRWMQNDVSAAASHTLTLNGAAGRAAAHAVAGYWSRANSEQCESWIASITNPELKSSAFSAFVDHRVLVDRVGVERLQAETADPGLRAILDQALGR